MRSTNRRIAQVFAASKLAAVAFFTSSLALSSLAMADQFVVMDETWTHTPDLADSHKRFDPSVSTPDDWTSPVDYSQGTAWVYLEVHTKPTAQETKFQVCFEANPTYACTDQSPTYTTVGTYEWSTPFSSFWSPPGESVDWSQGDNKLACILKDTMNNKPSADNVGPEMAALYTPTEVRMVVTIVAPGSTYVPPIPTGEGGAGGGASSSSASASSTSAVTSASATATVSTSGATTGSGGSGGTNGGDSSDGCSVSRPSISASATSESDRGGMLWVIPAALTALFWRSRRRRSPLH